MIVLKLDKIASQSTLNAFDQEVKRILSGQTMDVFRPLKKGTSTQLVCYSFDFFRRTPLTPIPHYFIGLFVYCYIMSNKRKHKIHLHFI